MKIIDFEKKGNVIRFYLGEKTAEWGWVNPNYKDYNGNTPSWLKPADNYWGDDWDDRPYEHNAGLVYSEFIKGYKDINFPFDYLVLEPSNGIWEGSNYSKKDMIDRRTPCILAIKINPPKVPEAIHSEWHDDSFERWSGSDTDQVIKYYFGDELEPDVIY